VLMAERRSLRNIYTQQRHLDRTVPSRRRVGIFTGLAAPLIVLLALHAVPLAVKIGAVVMYVAIGLWAGITSGRMARAEKQGASSERGAS